MKKIVSVILTTLLVAGSFAGCTGSTGSSGSASSQGSTAPATSAAEASPSAAANEPATSFDLSKEITVVSREDGSGTRGAFIELFGIEEKGADGTKSDKTTKDADIAPKTDIMLTSVSGNPYAIGYVSLGSLNDSVKAVDIDGVAATVDNIKNGTYQISRPFNIATKGEATELAKDFIDFILSSEGQAVVAGSYIAISDAPAAYAGNKPEGKIVVAGSSSVTPIMEKLKEAYVAINPNATIEIQQSDSSTGMNAAIDGTCDIGMASRELKDSELESLTSTSIALDGIAVIVNTENSITGLTSESVKAIFTGASTKWEQAA